MIADGFQFYIKSQEVIKSFRNHPKLEFTGKFVHDTGECFDQQLEARYKGLRFAWTKRGVKINGNLPLYFTGLSNIGPACYEETLAAVQGFCEEFGCKAEDVMVMKLELGHNVETNHSPIYIMDNIITYLYKRKETKTFRGTGFMINFPLYEYELRIYDKAKKNKLNEDLLRIELVFGSKLLRRLGVYTLADLLSKKKMEGMFNFLTRRVNDCVFDDKKIDLKSLTKRKAAFITKYRDIASWEELKESNPDYCRKQRAKFRRDIEKHCTFNWRTYLVAELKKVFEEKSENPEQKLSRFSAVDK